MNIDQKILIDIVKEAGKSIMDIYEDPKFSNVVDYKGDNSPLTLADKASHEVIDKSLKKHYPLIPIISEESEENIDYNIRKNYTTFWLVDPLDGTKEFINRNGEFTVNIALIENNVPTHGFIYVPVRKTLYYSNNKGAFKIDENGIETHLKVNNSEQNRIAVRSKSHAAPEEQEVLDKYNVVDNISVGSSLKFCMVAEGKADIYYRHGPTMEWDTAAGQAVLRAAGGKVLIETGPETFQYNKENLLNTGFLCLGF